MANLIGECLDDGARLVLLVGRRLQDLDGGGEPADLQVELVDLLLQVGRLVAHLAHDGHVAQPRDARRSDRAHCAHQGAILGDLQREDGIISRRLNGLLGVLGLYLNDLTIVFLLTLMDKSVSHKTVLEL